MHSKTAFTVVAFGEILWDLLPSGPVIGGAPFNFTYRINELGNEGLIVSCLGTDDYGQQARERIRELNMPADYVQQRERPTGTVEIFLDEHQEPHYTIIPDVAYDYIGYHDPLRELAQRAHCLCFGTLAQRNEQSRATLNRLVSDFVGDYVLYDINLRPDTYTTDVIRTSLGWATILKLNEDEAEEIAALLELSASGLPEIGQALVAQNHLAYCVITLGERGVLGFSAKGEVHYVPTFQIHLTDPLGAGDAFTAGFVHALLWQQPLEQACRYGNALGASVASQAGGTQRVAGAEVKDLIRRGRLGPIDARFKKFLCFLFFISYLSVQLWENHAWGQFTNHIPDQGKERHLGTQPADLNGDDNPDRISVGWAQPKVLHVWRGDARRG